MNAKTWLNNWELTSIYKTTSMRLHNLRHMVEKGTTIYRREEGDIWWWRERRRREVWAGQRGIRLEVKAAVQIRWLDMSTMSHCQFIYTYMYIYIYLWRSCMDDKCLSICVTVWSVSVWWAFYLFFFFSIIFNITMSIFSVKWIILYKISIWFQLGIIFFYL